MSKTYTNRSRKLLNDKINSLSHCEHEEIFKIVRDCMPGCNYTKNVNGFFFNMSSFNDEVMLRIDAFVSFCGDNKKKLDDYDKYLKECKLKNTTPFSFKEIHSDVRLDEVAIEVMAITVSNCDVPEIIDSSWKDMLDTNENALEVAKVLYNMDRIAKKKVYTKFHAAKKRFSKRIATEKRSESELMNDLSK